MKFNCLMKRICLAMLFAVGVLSASALAQQSGGQSGGATSGGAMSGGTISGGATSGGTASGGVLIPNYTPVTDKRLQNPEPKNWLMYKGNYSTWGYSPLEQINTDNVYSLKPVWTFSTGEVQGHEGAPIVNNGVMFATGAYSTLFALDAKTGHLLWSYRRDLPKDVYYEDCCGVVNRGVALYGNNVYLATLDAHLLAFNAKTGKIVWDTKVANYKDGYTMTLAPLAAKGKIVVGVSGASTASAASLKPSTRKRARASGRPTPWLGLISRGDIPGRATPTNTGAARFGRPVATTQPRTCSIGASATADLSGQCSGMGTISLSAPCSPWT